MIVYSGELIQRQCDFNFVFVFLIVMVIVKYPLAELVP
jgi:hypothetical protein